MKRSFLILFIIFFLGSIFTGILHAQQITSECVVTQVGSGDPNQSLPPGCTTQNNTSNTTTQGNSETTTGGSGTTQSGSGDTGTTSGGSSSDGNSGSGIVTGPNMGNDIATLANNIVLTVQKDCQASTLPDPAYGSAPATSYNNPNFPQPDWGVVQTSDEKCYFTVLGNLVPKAYATEAVTYATNSIANTGGFYDCYGFTETVLVALYGIGDGAGIESNNSLFQTFTSGTTAQVGDMINYPGHFLIVRYVDSGLNAFLADEANYCWDGWLNNNDSFSCRVDSGASYYMKWIPVDAPYNYLYRKT